MAGRRRGQTGKIVTKKAHWWSAPDRFVVMPTGRFQNLNKPKTRVSWSTPLGETVFRDRRTGRPDRRTRKRRSDDKR